MNEISITHDGKKNYKTGHTTDYFFLIIVFVVLSYSFCCQQSAAHYVFILDTRSWRFPVISQCI